ncbi:hypothetical protein QWY28_17205 [Nocardioides sp. SOB77]|uniref:Uncharacterized protein n=1 Tax=Nocardioides oceani TaxID=3058369 RepID=A0ABT8FKP4_9ACTN|nr:hypothetical protein [Nocardioides oceani]MDN4174702.1 hypothetical protein [Nocardioides oceani]
MTDKTDQKTAHSGEIEPFEAGFEQGHQQAMEDIEAIKREAWDEGAAFGIKVHGGEIESVYAFNPYRQEGFDD